MDNHTHPFIALAKNSVAYFIENGKPLPCPEDLSDELEQKAAAFVSIKNKKKLRGCIGTLTPQKENLATEIIYNAISSASKDPRFSPITTDELDDLTYSIDVLSQPEEISSPEELDSKVYGVIVKAKEKQGVLLPNLEGVDSVEEQIKICRSKAKIKADEPVELLRFRVKRYN